jgi:hypothetical protein
MAGMANAATMTDPANPGHSFSPSVKAHPAPSATPGWRNHHGMHHIEALIHNGYRP